MTIQHKALSLSATEFKFTNDGALEFSGYASVFDGIDSYGDTIRKGAYTDTLDPEKRKRPILLRWNHFGPVIGKFTEIRQDDKGLFVTGELTKGHSVAEDAAALLRHGAISGLSIGYYAKEEEFEGPIRVLKAIELIEISVVEEPADLNAQIDTVKSAFSGCESLADVESKLRSELGLSRSNATAIVASVKAAISQSESDSKNEQLELAKLLNSKFV